METLIRPSLAEKVAGAKARLDAHVRETVAWHFDPATGSPFWLERASGLGFDPRSDVRRFEDLALFGHFDGSWLRGGPLRRFLPRGFAGRPAFVFETGGSTGVPKSRLNVEDFQLDYEELGESLPDTGFPRGADWLMLGPTGPRRLRLAIEHLAQHRGGICFHVDLDPRWVNKLISGARYRELEAYKAHVVEQGLTVLRAHEVRCLFTTPKLLEALCERISLTKLGIRGILCGGTEMTAQFHRFAREELVPGAELVPVYGNTLMGLARPEPFDPVTRDYAITYYPPSPRAVFELVDPADPQRTVAYGETGRVMLTTLTRDFFMPRLLERDEGERARPTERHPWDGVTNLRLLSELQDSVVVGVY